MAFSMENLTKQGEKIQNTMAEKANEAQEMRREIDSLKEGLSGVPDGLDPEIINAIKEAEEAGKSEAIADIEGVESEAEAAGQEGTGVVSNIDQKISENNTAVSKMESVHKTRYGGGVESAISAAKDNTAQGEEAKRVLEEAMRKAQSDIERSKSGI